MILNNAFELILKVNPEISSPRFKTEIKCLVCNL